MSVTTAPVRRAYVEGRFGQMHLRRSEPAIPGATRPLLLFHMSPYSSVIFESFAAEMGRDRLTVAIDTPGFGASDAPPTLPEIPDYAAAMGDVMDALGVRDVDVMGYHTGSKIALELARQRPKQINRIVMVSAAVFTDAELEEHRETYSEQPLSADGDHLAKWWKAAIRWSMKGRSLEQIAQVFPARMLNPSISWWGHRAAFNFKTGDVLPKTEQPILILNPEDDIWAFTPRARELLRHPASRIHDLPGWSHGFLDLKTTEAAAIVRAFLDT